MPIDPTKFPYGNLSTNPKRIRNYLTHRTIGKRTTGTEHASWTIHHSYFWKFEKVTWRDADPRRGPLPYDPKFDDVFARYLEEEGGPLVLAVASGEFMSCLNNAWSPWPGDRPGECLFLHKDDCLFLMNWRDKQVPYSSDINTVRNLMNIFIRKLSHQELLDFYLVIRSLDGEAAKIRNQRIQELDTILNRMRHDWEKLHRQELKERWWPYSKTFKRKPK